MTINASDLLPVRTASCSVMGDYALKKKMTVPYSKAKKGDVVLYDFNNNGTSDHTGIIYKVSGGKIYVVEGNTSTSNNCNGGAVMKRVRVKGNVNYIIRPKYTAKVTADMIVATALAEVGVKESPKNSNNVKYNTWYYGHPVKGSAYPWCMVFVQWCFAHVKETKPKATATLKKPTGKYSGTIPTGTLKKGSKGTKVKQLQTFLNWYGIKCTCDGKFGDKTKQAVKKFQRTEGIGQDGVWGSHSYSKAKAYKANAPKPAPKPTPAPAKTTGAQKLLKKADELAWAYGTPEAKYKYKTGAPRAVCKAAMKKYGWADNKGELSDCGNFVSTIVRESGVSKTFKALHGTKTPFPKSEAGFKIVHTGAIPAGLLKPGDIIRYKKKNGNQHAMMYYAPGKVCEASHYNVFGVIRKDTKRYADGSKVKKDTIQVLRAK